jgi:hypothetical protein
MNIYYINNIFVYFSLAEIFKKQRPEITHFEEIDVIKWKLSGIPSNVDWKLSFSWLDNLSSGKFSSLSLEFLFWTFV